MLILEILGIVVSAFSGFFCTMWFFDRNFDDKHKGFCVQRCALKGLVLAIRLGFLALAVYLSVTRHTGPRGKLENTSRGPSADIGSITTFRHRLIPRRPVILRSVCHFPWPAGNHCTASITT